MRIVIGRPVNGIGINGLEYALTDKGEYFVFDSVEIAKQFLRDNGITDEQSLEDDFVYVNGDEAGLFDDENI